MRNQILNGSRNPEIILLKVDLSGRSFEIAIWQDLLFAQHHDNLGNRIIDTGPHFERKKIHTLTNELM